jgi:hypothetical protein
LNSANKKTAVLLELKVHLKMYDEILIGQQFFVLTSFLSRICSRRICWNSYNFMA